MVKKIVAICLANVLLSLSIQASAHIMNDQNTFDDLAYSEAADEIVLLAGLNIVAAVDGSSFKPQQILSMKQLSIWLANYYRLQGETTEALAVAAQQAGLVDSLEGEATYRAVNAAYFRHAVEWPSLEETMTHEQFAQFIAANLTEQMIQQAGFTEGPSGIVESVQTVEKVVDGKTQKVNVITVADEQYELTAHPYAIADSTDPAIWVGEKLTASYYGSADQHAAHDVQGLQLLVFGETQLIPSMNEQVAPVTIEQAVQQVTKEAQPEQKRTVVPYIFIALAGIAVVTATVVVRKNKVMKTK